MIDKNPLNATDLRHALVEIDRSLRQGLDLAIGGHARALREVTAAEEFGRYQGHRRALWLLHLHTSGEYGVSGDDMPERLPSPEAAG